MQTFIAFPGSEHLNTTTDNFIQLMASDSARREVAMLEDIMSHFTSEALHAFFRVPAEQLELKGAMMKIVNATISTIRGASSLLVSRTAPKLDLEQIRQLAQYMDVMRIKIPDKNGEDVWHVSFPLKDTLHQQAQAGLEQLRLQHYDEAREHLTEFLLGMTDEGLFWYMEQPLGMLGLGSILTAICKTGTETARKGSRAVINKIVRKQQGEALVQIGTFIEDLIVRSEPRRPEQALD